MKAHIYFYYPVALVVAGLVVGGWLSPFVLIGYGLGGVTASTRFEWAVRKP